MTTPPPPGPPASWRTSTSAGPVLDPTGTGSVGPGYVFDDEALEGATYPRDTVQPR